MKYTGKVMGGVIVLESDPGLKDGTIVYVEPTTESKISTVGARLKKFAGSMKNLPDDLARNHDHYLHGHAKK